MSVYNDPIYDRLYDGRSIQENYYVEPQKNERGRVVSKEEKQKKLELYQNKHTYIITADHPAYETLSSVTVTPMIEETIVVDPSKTESGYDSYLIPHKDPSTPETATKCPNGKEEINMPIQQNGKHTLQREESQFIDKVNVDVNVKNIYDLNKDQIPEGTQVAVISPIPEGQLPGVMKKAITKQITTTENGTQTYSCPATQYWDKVTVNTNVPQSVTLDPNEVPDGWHVIVIPPDPEHEEIEPEAKVKMYEHKEVTITENGTTTVTATNEDMQVLKDVKVTVQVPQTVTAAENPTGYDIIQIPTYDPETGKWDPDAEGQRLQMYRTEKTLDVIENGEYTVTPASNELITKVNVNVNVEAQTMNIMNDNGTVEGHDTFIVDKEEGHEDDDPIIYSTVKFVEPEITCTRNKDYTIESTISTDQECQLIKKATIHVNIPLEGNFEEKNIELTKDNTTLTGSTITKEILPSEDKDAMTKVTTTFNQSIFRDGYKIRPVQTTIYGETGQFIIGDALFYNMAEAPSSATGGTPRPYSFRSHDRNYALTGALHKTFSISKLSENEAVITDYDLGHTMEGVGGKPKHYFMFAVIRDNRFAIWLFMPNQEDSSIYPPTRTSGNTYFYDYTWVERDKKYENYKGVVGWANGFTTSGGAYDGVDASDIIKAYRMPSSPISWTPGFPRLHLISSSFMVDVMQESTSLRTAFIGCDTPLDSTYNDVTTIGYVGTLRYNGNNTSSYDVVEIATGHDILDSVTY